MIPNDFHPYEILGIPPDATDGQIKSAFRKKSVSVHPDQNPNDPEAAEKFQGLMKVRDFLLDPFRRRAYNVKMGFLRQQQTVQWWSDWETIFGEIQVDEEEYLAITPGERDWTACRPTSSEKTVDVAIYGATGVTGALACVRLLRKGKNGPTWSVAGRSEAKMRAVAEKLGRGENFRGAYCGATESELDEFCRNARVVLNCAGPVERMDPGLFDAALKHGCHYIGITGNPYWVRSFLQDKYDVKASKKGLSWVPMAGFVSALGDYCVKAVVDHLRTKHSTTAKRVHVYHHSLGGGFSGSSLESGLRWAAEHPEQVKVFWENPFYFHRPKAAANTINKDLLDQRHARYDPISQLWVVGETLGASANDNRSVHWSAHLAKRFASEDWGADMSVHQYSLFPNKDVAEVSESQEAMPPKKTFQAQADGKLPPVGFGLGERIRKETVISKLFYAEGENGKECWLLCQAGPGGSGDGYEGTATLALETALCLAAGELPKKAGVLPPGFAMSRSNIMKNLGEAGFRFRLHDGRPPVEVFRNIIQASMPLEDSGAALADTAEGKAGALSAAAAPAAAPTPTAGGGPRWEVVASTCLVRTGADLKSPEAGRWARGVVLEQLEQQGSRYRARLVSGEGPGEGWVSASVGGKEVIKPMAAAA